MDALPDDLALLENLILSSGLSLVSFNQLKSKKDIQNNLMSPPEKLLK